MHFLNEFPSTDISSLPISLSCAHTPMEGHSNENQNMEESSIIEPHAVGPHPQDDCEPRLQAQLPSEPHSGASQGKLRCLSPHTQMEENFKRTCTI